MHADSPSAATSILPLQPRPLAVHFDREHHPDGWRTTVARLWRPEDAARCQLCPIGSCCADRYGLCQVTVNSFIPDGELALLSIRGRRLL